MKKLLVISLFLPVLFSFHAIAGNSSGGGGAVVLCKSPKGKITTQLFDFFEAEELQNDAKPSMGPPSLFYKQKIQLVLDRWAKIDPGLAKIFGEKIQSYYNDMAFLDRAAISDLVDRDEIFGPNGNCTLKSAAVFRTNPMPGEKSKLIDKSIWALADNDTRAGLVLHEVVYSAFKRNLHSEDSRIARYFVVFISSNKMDGISAVDYRKIIEAVGLGEFYESTIVFKNFLLSHLEISTEDFVRSGSPTLPAIVSFQGQDIQIVNEEGRWTPSLTFDKDGQVISMGSAKIANQIEIALGDNKVILPPGSHIEFNHNRVIRFDRPKGSPILDLIIHGVLFHTLYGTDSSKNFQYYFGNPDVPQEIRAAGNLDFIWNGKRIKITGLTHWIYFYNYDFNGNIQFINSEVSPGVWQRTYGTF